ncbi:MAG: DUF4982 domain-containing protein [Prevotella sp.]|nr:DUF4982 domain-containing protein [Prevotella sp.]
MKRLLILALTLLLTLSAGAQREKIRLDEGWRFAFGNASDPVKDFGCGTEYFNYLTKAASLHNAGPYAPAFDDGEWREVRVPHDWATTLPYDADASHSHGYKPVGYKYPETSVGWYRLHVKIPETDLGRHLYLQFDGIYRDARVWFNGVYMGSEPSGYATQVYDITDYINYGGDNLVCVRADATLAEGWFYEGAGIYRDVWLVKEAEVHVGAFGTFAYSDISADYSSALLTVETEIENSSLAAADCIIRTTLIDGAGREAGRADDRLLHVGAKDKASINDIHINVDRPNLWDLDTPYLYEIRTEVIRDGATVDTYVTRTGIRRVEFTAENGFFLNGRNIKLKGVNIHQDHAGAGTAMPEALMRWRVKRLKAFGCNSCRTAHNPVSPALLDICDEEGILVVEENRLMGTNDYHVRLLENFIRRDRNHPCIILWSDGNEEWGLENSVTGTRVAASMREITRRLDPTRRSTVANAGGTELIKGTDVAGYNYIVQNDVYNRRNEYPDRVIAGTEETTGCGTRGVYFNYEDVPGRMVSLNRIPADSLHGVDYNPLSAQNTPESYTQGVERGWRFYGATPWAAGCFFWTGFDYRGEPNPLTYPAHDSEFGVLDYCGFFKDEAHYLKGVWTDTPSVHILPHWNLSGHEGGTIDIWAYSNCEEVSLNVNGEALGRQPMPQGGHASWKAVYKPGRVVAKGYIGGEAVAVDTVETSENAARIKAYADRTMLVADGQDVAVVNIDLTDGKDRFVPDACPELTFSLTGEGRIIGAGNGDPACGVIDHPEDINCKSFAFPAFNGHAQVIIQTTKTAGDIRLVCSGDGLAECAVDMSSYIE